jgi:hypothetical protein
MIRVVTLVAILVGVLGGCATIFSGGPDPVELGSKPEGATVIVNGQNMGMTPVTLKLEPSKTYIITFKKEGFEDASVTLNSHVQPGWVVLDILAGILGVAIDAATGDWKAFDQGQHFIELKATSSGG